MATFRQLLRKKRGNRRRKYRSSALEHTPQRKGICTKIYTLAPKKPNSAKRKVAQVKLSTKKKVICYIAGEGHNLVSFNSVLVRGGKVPDLPGVKYTLVRGVLDLKAVSARRHGRSKYGTNRDYRGRIEAIKFPHRLLAKKRARQKPSYHRACTVTSVF